MNQQTIKFCWWSGSPSGYRDCFFSDSSLLGDTESGINRLRCSTLQCTACTSRHRHSNYDTGPRQRDWYRDTGKTGALAEVCTAPVLLVLYFTERVT